MLSDNQKFVELCRNGVFDDAKELLESGNIDIHYKNDLPFRTAASHGKLNIVKWLWNQGGIDISAEDDYAICWACHDGHLDTAKWLVEHGAYIHADNGFPFKEAFRGKHYDICHWIISITKGIYSFKEYDNGKTRVITSCPSKMKSNT